MKKIILLFPFIFLFISACTFEKGEVPQPVAGCVNDSTIDVIEVTIGDDFFSPSSIEITEGDTVKWTYVTGSGFSSHTTTSTTIPFNGTSWDSGFLSLGNSFKQGIVVPGSYTYICSIHPSNMTGTIIVKPRCK